MLRAIPVPCYPLLLALGRTFIQLNRILLSTVLPRPYADDIWVVIINKGYLLFWVNTKYISSSVVKKSVFSQVPSTSENADIFTP